MLKMKKKTIIGRINKTMDWADVPLGRLMKEELKHLMKYMEDKFHEGIHLQLKLVDEEYYLMIPCRFAFRQNPEDPANYVEWLCADLFYFEDLEVPYDMVCLAYDNKWISNIDIDLCEKVEQKDWKEFLHIILPEVDGDREDKIQYMKHLIDIRQMTTES
jgi:hypothetical protein